MKRYVLFVGGTGARMAEAMLVAASAGVMRADVMDVLLADTDVTGSRSAELLKAKYTDYARIQSVVGQMEAPGSICPFRTVLNFHAWPRQLPGGVTTLAEWTADSETDALLCQALFSEEAARKNLRGGFHGQRTLGKTAFAGLIHASEQDSEDELNRLIANMNHHLDAGEEVRVALAGSMTGGTGAAGLPLLARHIRDLTQGRAQIGAVLLAAADAGENASKSREAIAEFAGESACGAICVLGLPLSSCPAAPADYAHLTDWLAVYCMDVMLHRPRFPEGLFTVQSDIGSLTWDIFGKAADRYRLAYGRLIKTAAAWVAILGPQVDRRLQHPFFLRDSLFGWYAHFLRRPGNLRVDCVEDVARTTRLMQVVLLWVGGLMRTLPPEMTHAAELAEANVDAEAHYREMTELAGQLAVLDEEVQRAEMWDEERVYRGQEDEEDDVAQNLRRIDAVKQEIAHRRQEQEKLNRRVGGAAMMGLMHSALADAEAESAELLERYAEANRRIDHAETIAAPEDQYRITDARTKLDRMVRHQQMLNAREEFIRSDVRGVEEDPRRYERPAVSGAGAGNGMFDPEMTADFLRPDGLKAKDVEERYPGILQPEDGRTLKTTLKRIRRAEVNEYAPVISLLHALMMEAMEEVEQ